MGGRERECILGRQISEDGIRRLEVALVPHGGTTRIELRLLGWGEGIDWYVQKSLQLDRFQVSALKGMLGRAEGRVKSIVPRLKMTCNIEEYATEYPQRPNVSVYP
jgi:hypothetical protein